MSGEGADRGMRLRFGRRLFWKLSAGRTSSSERGRRPSRARLGVAATSPPVGESEQSRSRTSGPGLPALRDMLFALGSAVPRTLGRRSAARRRSCPRALGRRLRPADGCARGQATTRPTREAAAPGAVTLTFPELISPRSPICYFSGVVLQVKPCLPQRYVASLTRSTWGWELEAE